MPDWDELPGKTILLGLTFTDSEGDVIEQVQRHGIVQSANRAGGIATRLIAPGQPWDGELYVLPPDLDAVSEASPGAYRLRSTGETIVDPDLLASWEIRSPSPKDDTAELRAAREEEARRFGFPTG